jgi:hypothetical protein
LKEGLKMVSSGEILRKIKSIRPDLIINNYIFDARHEDFYKAIINDREVFKFAKQELNGMECVIKNKMKLSEKIEFKIPKILEYRISKMDILDNYYYYRIEGNPIKENKDIYEKILKSLSQLHSVSPEILDYRIPLRNSKDKIIEIYKEAKKEVFPYLKKDEIEYLKYNFDKFIDLKNDIQIGCKLIHGSLNKFKIYENENQEIFLDDFDGIKLGDPALDVYPMIDAFGKEFLELAYKNYDKKLIDKAIFYSKINKLKQKIIIKKEKDEEEFLKIIKKFA